MANSGEKHRAYNVSRPLDTLTNSRGLTMSLVGLIALVYSFYIVAPRSSSLPFREPHSDAVDHVNP